MDTHQQFKDLEVEIQLDLVVEDLLIHTPLLVVEEVVL
tara:strand:- start:440 stop:553 length:114 start_codon:yes stop_codon:yes gene_type:complete